MKLEPRIVLDVAEDSLSFAQKWVRRFFSVIPFNEWPYWFSAILTGFIVVIYAKLARTAELYAAKWSEASPYYLWIVSPFAFWLAFFVVEKVSPLAKGSGIPQVMAAIEGLNRMKAEKFYRDAFGVRAILIKILSSFLVLIGGGAVGREGPSIQIAAGIFYRFGFFARRWEKRISNEIMLIAGGASGLAAAFNTPLGGLVFALEELSHSTFTRVKSSIFSAVILAGVSAQWVAGGTYLLFGYPKLTELAGVKVLWAVPFGIVLGLAGAIFGKLLFRLVLWRAKLSKAWLHALPIFLGLSIAAIITFIDRRALGSGTHEIAQLLFGGQISEDAGVSLVIVRFFAPIVSYLVGGASGVFAPALAAGASIGSWMSTIMAPDLHSLFIVLGMIGFLTGFTRSPFTAFVLVLEMTDRHSSIFPMMLTAVFATAGAVLVDRISFYEHMKEAYLEAMGTPKT
ncbi:MAG: chloride channel protein [Oligoflexia bacterium]|nr:chloride channel protein [Oligoflexia bacterium]